MWWQVASAKSFSTLCRNYPDRLLLVVALASPQPLWVFVLTTSSSGTLSILLTSGTLGLLLCCHTWGNRGTRLGGRALCRVTEGWAQLERKCLAVASPACSSGPLSHCPLPGTGELCPNPAVSMELTLFSLLTVGSRLRRRSRTRQCCWTTWYVCLSSPSFCQWESRA